MRDGTNEIKKYRRNLSIKKTKRISLRLFLTNKYKTKNSSYESLLINTNHFSVFFFDVM